MTNEIVKVEEKEVAEYQNQVSFVQKKADELIVASEDDMAVASDLRDDVKKVEKAYIERKQAITRPLMASLASTRDLFKPLEKAYASAKETINDKMLAYNNAEEERITKETNRVEKRVEKGTMRADTAVRKIEEAGEVKKSFDGLNSKISIRKVTKIRIVDEDQIPREFMIPDLKQITEAVLRGKQTIAGVETYEEKSIASLTR